MIKIKSKIPIGKIEFDKNEFSAIMEILKSNRISEGINVKKFEEKMSEYLNTKFVIALNSGTSALICSMTALKYSENFELKEKQKVITTPLTFAATSNAIVLSNLEPVFVDVNENDFLINAEKIKELLEASDNLEEYGLIVPVNLMGYPCEIDKINKIAKKYNLNVLNDCAQSHGTKYKGETIGSKGLLNIFSFYISHNIQAGEMGAISTNNKELSEIISKIKVHGRAGSYSPYSNHEKFSKKLIELEKTLEDVDPRFTHEYIGFNFKTTEFQAAIAIEELKKTKKVIKKRQENVKYLNEELKKFSNYFELPSYSKEVDYFGYPLIVNSKKIKRKKIRELLEKKGIESRPLFGCIPFHQPAYINYRKQYEGLLPNAKYYGENGFYVTCNQYLTDNDLDYIVKSFEDIFRNLS